ncbi:MAG: cation:proton antiporter [Desulfuromonadales bacterium]|nr:cation:proton antiporter [Desulfuromonadales bacterium]NIS42320.1 cation:proton antiporter [Desulfuromonadales bacterium]
MILQLATSFVVFPLLAGALVLAFIRLLRGPSLADRIIAFDLIAASSAGIIVVTAVTTGKSVLLDAASIWAVIAFLSVIAFAWYIERRGGV